MRDSKYYLYMMGRPVILGLVLMAFAVIGYPALLSRGTAMPFTVGLPADKYGLAILAFGVVLILFSFIITLGILLYRAAVPRHGSAFLTVTYVSLLFLIIISVTAAALLPLDTAAKAARLALYGFIAFLLIFLGEAVYRGMDRIIIIGHRLWSIARRAVSKH